MRSLTLAMGKLNRELAMIDSVLGGPVKALYFSALQGKESHYYLRSRNLYPNSSLVTDDSALILRSPRDYEARYETVEPYEITRLSHEAVRALYGDTIQLSATKLESVSACRFEYFLILCAMDLRLSHVVRSALRRLNMVLLSIMFWNGPAERLWRKVDSIK